MSECRISGKRLAVAALLLSASCVPALTQNPPRDPQLPVPAQFDVAAQPMAPDAAQPMALDAAQPTTSDAGQPMAPDAGQPEATAPQGAVAAAESWRTLFDDPYLVALIEVALQNNQELNIRLQEVIIAKSEIMSRQGEYLPRVDARVGAGAEKVGKYTSQGAADEANGVPKHLQHYDFGFVASWEVDIWKKLRNAAKAATFRYLSSIEGKSFVVTQLVAEIASSYYELMALDRQLEVLRRSVGGARRLPDENSGCAEAAPASPCGRPSIGASSHGGLRAGTSASTCSSGCSRRSRSGASSGRSATPRGLAAAVRRGQRAFRHRAAEALSPPRRRAPTMRCRQGAR